MKFNLSALALAFSLALPVATLAGERVSLLRFESPVSANVIVASLRDQTHRITLATKEKSVEQLINKHRQELLVQSKALQIESFGCGSQGSGAIFDCEIHFSSWGVGTDAKPYGVLILAVNSTNKTVRILKDTLGR